LTYEIIHYAKKSQQSLLFLKLDFFKAYDKVGLGFLFPALEKLGFPTSFNYVIYLLIQGAITRMSINGKSTQTFEIQ
jgi:hypothetical protein